MVHTLCEICGKFNIHGECIGYREIHSGIVNSSYAIYFRKKNEEKCYFLQKVNEYVFKNPIAVMNNIDKVTEYIQKKYPERTCVKFYHTSNGDSFVKHEGIWRVSDYIDSFVYAKCPDTDTIRDAGRSFGSFQMALHDFDASTLEYTIKDFHNTRKRFDDLYANKDKAYMAQDEFDWLMSVRDKACTLTDLFIEGKLPLRVTHNDTKINNVLFDKVTKRAITVIDFDTVMPGLVGHDFGDAIRSAANTVAEDCTDISSVSLDLDIFRAFTEGFLCETISVLTENELKSLPVSCFALAAELSTRFLNDYFQGNLYFKTSYPEHNLVRARCQIALAKDMLKKMDCMEKIVAECAASYK